MLMIETRKQLRQYLKLDSQSFSNLQGFCGLRSWYYKIRCNPISNNWIIWSYIKALRHAEYYINISKGGGRIIYLIPKLYYLHRLRSLSYKTGYQIPPNTCGPGLGILHYGTIIIHNNVRIGANCTLHTSVLIGLKQGEPLATIGDNVFIGAGTKIIGDVTIGDDVVIGQNCVIVKDIPSGSVVVNKSAATIINHRK